MVANRLPYTIQSAGGLVGLVPAPGGLATRAAPMARVIARAMDCNQVYRRGRRADAQRIAGASTELDSAVVDQVRDYKAVRKLLLTLLQTREATPVMVSPMLAQVSPM